MPIEVALKRRLHNGGPQLKFVGNLLLRSIFFVSNFGCVPRPYDCASGNTLVFQQKNILWESYRSRQVRSLRKTTVNLYRSLRHENHANKIARFRRFRAKESQFQKIFQTTTATSVAARVQKKCHPYRARVGSERTLHTFCPRPRSLRPRPCPPTPFCPSHE